MDHGPGSSVVVGVVMKRRRRERERWPREVEGGVREERWRSMLE